MKNTFGLSKIGFYNPGRLSDEEIEIAFIARKEEFSLLLASILQETPGSIPQHHLVVGQRGMGKTTLLVRLAAELRKLEHKVRFIPLSFPEEQYNVDRLSKFWLNCLDALADALDREGEGEMTNLLDLDIRSLDARIHLNPDEIFARFEHWSQKTGRRPVLLVDNLNLIFSKIDQKEQHLLRAILMREDAPIVVGASAVVPEETVAYSAPFYDGFQMHYLAKLRFGDSMKILIGLAEITGKPEVARNAAENKPRLQALYHLTGGTPRTIAMLFPLLRDGFGEGIQSDLEGLLDQITPLYKARFEELSEQQQVILDAIALHWDPITLSRLREKSGLENNVLSSQLKRLTDLGWIDKLDQEKKKFPAYEITERFFNIWYLMRRSSRRQKQELYCLSRFLEVYYGHDILEVARMKLGEPSVTSDQVFFNMALTDAIKGNSELVEKWRTKNEDDILSLKEPPTEFLSLVSDERKAVEVGKLLGMMFESFDNQRYRDCIQNANRLAHLGYLNLLMFVYSARSYEQLGEYSSAYKEYLRFTEFNNSNSQIQFNMAELCQDETWEFTLAQNHYRTSIQLGNEPAAQYGLIFLLRDKLNRREDAFQLFKALQPENRYPDSFPLNQMLFSYYNNELSAAEGHIRKAMESLEAFFPPHTRKHWWRSAAVVVRLGYGQHFLNQLSMHRFEILIRPYFVAIQALMSQQPDLFLNGVAQEVREPARKMLDFMKRYNSGFEIQPPKEIPNSNR